ncbi:polyprenol monophosphomannose synthase [Pontibacter sp. G13]|uniref:polyprenol monophosphomannose synthase n=1 Tax=Pontibacter sp. G13 TaxID=3074898 RepID=UPI00288B358D|nr:polyprenol monophosphomannose synthase [Pontibacter sp. G13]WNJ18655.1 polyprenol monophosphomannose synthase [Pontibacter sp. G13]
MSNKIVIVPTYNEKENIELLIHKVMEVLPDTHMLIVEDSSPDGTADIVRRLMDQNYSGRLHMEERQGKLGLGTAYVHGFKWALERGYDYIFEMDADFSHNPKALPSLLRPCEEEGFDMTIGSRYVNGVNVVNWPMGRVLMSYYASAYVRFITGMTIRDATAGFKCYTRPVLETILAEPVKFVGYAFQIEMKFRTWKYGFKIKEVPIIFRDRTQGESKMSSKIFKEAVFGVISMKISSWFRKWNRPEGLPASTEKTQSLDPSLDQG